MCRFPLELAQLSETIRELLPEWAGLIDGRISLRTPEILAVFPWANTTASNQKHLSGKFQLKNRIIDARATLAMESSSGNLLSTRLFFVQISFLITRIVSFYQHFEG
jgi:hypothetical protein